MLKFGTGGAPLTSKKTDILTAIAREKELGLDLMEVEFVYGVKMQEETAKLAGTKSKELGIDLTIHGPYYINLATMEEEKLKSSINHIYQSAYIGNFFGAKSLTYHSAFFQKYSREEVFERVVTALSLLYRKLEEKDIKVVISPEVTGKPSQFGSLDELIALCKKFSKLRLCFDFAHNYARTAGKNNTAEEVKAALTQIKKELGDEYLKNMHIHMSNIEFSEKGERNHLPYLKDVKAYEKEKIDLGDKSTSYEKLDKVLGEFYKSKKVWKEDFDWRMILRVLKEMNVSGWIVCESPLLEWDALLMKKYYESL